MSAHVKTAADKAIDEKRQLSKLYRARQRQEIATAYADPVYGEPIATFILSLRRFTIDDADAIVIFIKGEADYWLRAAPEDIRALLLRVIDARIIAIRESNDMLPFDDPMPWQDDNVFRLAKKALGL